MTAPANNIAQDADRKRRIRRSVLWLSLLALSFYAGFIVLSVLRA